MYVDEKLSNLDKRSRRIAEKRISDVLFEAEMSLDLTEAGEQRNTFWIQLSVFAATLRLHRSSNPAPRPFHS